MSAIRNTPPLLGMSLAAWVVFCGGCEPQRGHKAASRNSTPQRIISISPNSTEILGALGAADRLVAVSDFCLWPESVAELPKVGGLFDVNLEAVLRLEPDLVILRGQQRGVEQLCESNGIGLYRDRTERLEDVYTTMRELGELLDCESLSREAERQMRRRLDRIASAVAGRPKPRVLMILARDTSAIGSIMTGGKDTFIDDILTLAGGVNIFGDVTAAYPSISQEAILVAQPEVILEAMPEQTSSPELEAKIARQWREFGSMPAVDRGRVYILFDENVMIPSPRIVDVVEKVARLLHPEANLD